MKKLVLVCLIFSSTFGFASFSSIAENFSKVCVDYNISQKQYDELRGLIAKSEINYRVKYELLSLLTLTISQKQYDELRGLIAKSETNYRVKYELLSLLTLIKIQSNEEPTLGETISILKGKISSLEMRIIILEGKVK